MNNAAAIRVRLRELGDLIAAIPHMLGFHPRESLVVIVLNGHSVRFAVRVDLVDPVHAEALVGELVGPIRANQASAVVLVVVSEEVARTAAAAHAELVGEIARALCAHEIPVVQAACVARTTAGSPWFEYADSGGGGVLPDGSTSVMAAATAAAGLVTFESREQLANLIAADDGRSMRRRTRLLADADAEHPMDAALAAERMDLLERLYREAGAGRLRLDDETVAKAGSALCDPMVRDACLGWCLADGASVAEQVWIALVRATPAPYRAEPATLLAFCAYLRGDGAFAGIALEAALTANPEHTLAALLLSALHGGITPDALRGIAEDAVADALLWLNRAVPR